MTHDGRNFVGDGTRRHRLKVVEGEVDEVLIGALLRVDTLGIQARLLDQRALCKAYCLSALLLTIVVSTMSNPPSCAASINAQNSRTSAVLLSICKARARSHVVTISHKAAFGNVSLLQQIVKMNKA